MADAATEDERREELSSISAIYPELVINPTNPFAASLEIPVAPANPIKVRFPLPIDGSDKLVPPGTAIGGTELNHIPPGEDIHTLVHLPPLQLDLTLPEGYPDTEPPTVQVTTSLNWLPVATLKQLQEQAAILWEEYGHVQVVFAYIDHLQQAADNGFDTSHGTLDMDQDLKTLLLDFDISMKRQKFEQETFDCGICLEPKKGSSCYRLQKCRHVFCVDCLQDFYVNAITEGDVTNVKCLTPDCGVERDANTRRAKKAARTLGPNELLQIPIERSLVQRYVDLKRKKKFESKKDTVYCPRQWCQGPAGVKHRIKKEFSQIDDEDSASEPETTPAESETTRKKVVAFNDRLRICESCDFAFCRVCFSGWHGEFVRCWPKSDSVALELVSEEDQASYDYIRLHTSPCPTCASPCQKLHGCNHMKCYQCDTHFCYLCSSWLDGQNPYPHFINKSMGCFERLWDLEEGDEGDGQVQFAGARGWEAAAVAADEEEAAELLRQQQQPGVEPVVAVPAVPVALPQAAPGAAVRAAEAGEQPVPNPRPGPAGAARVIPFDNQLARRELADFLIVDRVPPRRRPGWQHPNTWGQNPHPAGRPRQERLPRLGRVRHFGLPRGWEARWVNDGQEDMMEIAHLGQQNYLRLVREEGGDDGDDGDDGDGEDDGEEVDHESDEGGYDELSEPVVPV